jgi:broad specificity phosphatase PhoE
MTLPKTLTLVRHGLSEANRIQSFMKKNDSTSLADLIDIAEVRGRHDSTARLAIEGVKQAHATGEWLRANMAGKSFERFYVSPHIRTRETAAHLELGGEWIVDDRFRERDWGDIANPNEDYTSALTPALKAQKKLNEWYWKPLGGESLATGVRARVEFVMESLHRRGDLDNVIAVTHGEFIRVAQFVIEKMTPDQFNDMDADPAFKVENTMVLEYTRVNPEDASDVREQYQWRRATCPWNERKSWNGGDWTEFHTRKFSDDDLLSFAETHPRFFNDERH